VAGVPRPPTRVDPPRASGSDTILVMTVPGRREAAQLLLSLEPSPKFLRHACAVADVAAWLAWRASANGHAVDRRLAETAALLHDVDKLPTAATPAHLRHGEGSAAWLESHGWPELAPAVRDHPVTRLAEPGHDGWWRTAPLEARIVAYADKRAAQHLAPMEARFARWRRKYPPGSDVAVRRTGGAAWTEEVFELSEERARLLEREVCAAAGARPDEVRRLRWSRRAIREVRAGGHARAGHEIPDLSP
jgi:hypothetical protein